MKSLEILRILEIFEILRNLKKSWEIVWMYVVAITTHTNTTTPRHSNHNEKKTNVPFFRIFEILKNLWKS